MSGDHNMRGEDHDEISTSTHFLPKPKTYGCDPNEFNPDWDQMAVLVERINELDAALRVALGTLETLQRDCSLKREMQILNSTIEQIKETLK